MWIRSKRSDQTRIAYARDIERLYIFTSKSLQDVLCQKGRACELLL
jgi:hypothetical protein